LKLKLLTIGSTYTYSEQELVLSLKQKDESAFSYLYDNYSAALNGVIYAMVGDVTLSEDILQEAFLKIWKNIDAYDDTKGKLYTWMRRLTHNLTLDNLKSNQHKYQQKVAKDEMAVVNIQVTDSVMGKLDSLDFKKKLDTLDPKQRQIIDLSYYQGYTQEEIAAQLDMPVGTVKTKIRAAIIELRKIFVQ
jgi:RNA polymerase sigma factor (sigma-70 family)